MKLSVVIPVFNEVNTIDEILSQVRAVAQSKQIIVVDDGSTDGTTQRLKQIDATTDDVTIIFHDRNIGKGAALRTGFQAVTGDIVIIQDADLEYNPVDYPVVIKPILDGKADVVYGSRFLGGPHRVLFFWHSVGNKLLTLLSNAMTNLNLTDMETCYKAFRTEVLEGLTIKSNRFGFEPEFTAKIARKDWRIYEVAISYSGRRYSEGKKITWRDGVKAAFLICWFRFFK